MVPQPQSVGKGQRSTSQGARHLLAALLSHSTVSDSVLLQVSQENTLFSYTRPGYPPVTWRTASQLLDAPSVWTFPCWNRKRKKLCPAMKGVLQPCLLWIEGLQV